MVKALCIVVTAAKKQLCARSKGLLYTALLHEAYSNNSADLVASLTVVFAERVKYATSTYKSFREITKDMNMNTMPSRS
jgi:hypothetical protein